MTGSRRRARTSGALLVGLGIGASRLSGLGRETIASRLLGNTAAGDAFAVAMRIPNLLQNLLGEGVLSATFVPVYSRLLHSEDADGGVDDAGRVAGAVAAALMLIVGLAVALIITFARPLALVLAPGLSAGRFELAVSLVRITALGTGLAVMSAWCLGILNSHRRFFLSYAAPVLWNAAQVAALIVAWILAFDLDDVARALAWGVAAGGLAQLAVQLPLTIRLAKGLRLRWIRGHSAVREIAVRAIPAMFGRGVVQVSAYADLMLASLLATGAVAALYRAQMLYLLPISLFAMSVAAAELPEMSRMSHDRVAVARRANSAMRRVAFWMLLASAAYLAAGDLLVGLLFEGGAFGSADTTLVWFVIAAYALGLPAAGVSRVLQNTCYALGDTAGPARIAAVRVMAAAVVGIVVMFPLDRVVVVPDGLRNVSEAWNWAWALSVDEREAGDTLRMGAVGLALGSAVAAWVEIALLARRLRAGRRVRAALAAPLGAAAVSFALTAALKLVVGDWPIQVSAPLVGAAATLTYAVVGHLSGVQESALLLRPIRAAIWNTRAGRR